MTDTLKEEAARIKAMREALEETEGYLVMTLEALHSHSHGIAVNFDRMAAGLSNNLAAVRAAQGEGKPFILPDLAQTGGEKP